MKSKKVIWAESEWIETILKHIDPSLAVLRADPKRQREAGELAMTLAALQQALAFRTMRSEDVWSWLPDGLQTKDMTHDEMITWGSGVIMDRFIRKGGDGLREGLSMVLMVATKDAYDRGVADAGGDDSGN